MRNFHIQRKEPRIYLMSNVYGYSGGPRLKCQAESKMGSCSYNLIENGRCPNVHCE